MSLLLFLDQFGIIQILQTPSIPQTSFFVGIFFAASYSKTALVYQIEVQEQDQINVQIQGKSGNFSSKLINVPASLFGTLEQVKDSYRNGRNTPTLIFENF